jgi:hypothetical protein
MNMNPDPQLTSVDPKYCLVGTVPEPYFGCEKRFSCSTCTYKCENEKIVFYHDKLVCPLGDFSAPPEFRWIRINPKMLMHIWIQLKIADPTN